MSPGPVSDSYDPEFGTGERAGTVRDALSQLDRRITASLGDALLDIVAVAASKDRGGRRLAFSARELRLLRFAIRRAVESI